VSSPKAKGQWILMVLHHQDPDFYSIIEINPAFVQIDEPEKVFSQLNKT